MRRHTGRRGATAVETSMVIGVAFLLLFGIIEYCRFVMTLQLLENAAREGARLAVANTDEKDTAAVKAAVENYLAGQQTQVDNYDCTVTAVVLRDRPDPKDTTKTVKAGTAVTDWRDTATSDGIIVEVTGDFTPLLPAWLSMPASIPVKAKCVMYSEGN